MIEGSGAGFAALAERDPVFAHCLAEREPPAAVMRPAGFAGMLRIILDQQVSTASGAAMWRRLTDTLGTVTPDGVAGLDDATLRTCGFSRQKMGYARGLAAALLDGSLDLAAVAKMDDQAALATLVRLKGIGRWSAEIYLLLHLGRPDIWPADDLAIQLGLQSLKGLDQRPTRAETDSLAEPWRPHRSAAARLIWQHYLAERALRPNPRAPTARPARSADR